MVSDRDELVVFADAGPAETALPTAADAGDRGAWKVAVVDDDQSVHAVTRLVLADLRFKGRPVQLMHACSAAQARDLLRSEPGIAVVLLDVVMESDHAGLDLVREIRTVLKNSTVRIILRTGQPGQAPEGRIIAEFDINDYKEKSELSAQKLVTAVTAALRGYDDLLTIQALSAGKQDLEALVQARTAELSDANRALRVQQSPLDEAEKIAAVGSYEWNLLGQQMVWSRQAWRLLGLAEGRTRPGLAVLLDMVPADERGLLEQQIEAALESATGFTMEHHLVYSDGTRRMFRHRGAVLRDEDGRLVRLAGILQDITEQHQASERMRKLATAVEQTADAVMITNAQGCIEYVNAAFTRMSGYAGDEVIGKTPRVLKSGRTPEIFYRRMWHAILRGEVFSDVLVNRRKDGALYHEALTISPQLDASGQVTHFIATGRDITDQVQFQARIEHLATHDSLTGLPNRALLMDRLEQAMARSKWRHRHVAVLFMDMDRFKVINDTLGHASGDSLLKAIAERLGAAVREGDTVARLGGDEFAVILNDVANAEDVERTARQLLDSVSAPFTIEGRELFVTTSIGVSMYPRDGEDCVTLLKRADVAMYNAKVSGKNRFESYTQRDEANELARLSLETQLRRALEREEFFLVFQPQIDAGSRKVISMEALLRWRRSDGDIVLPGEFISLLEETGMILAVGEWVLRKACGEAQAMRASGVELNRVAVNISLHQFRQAGFVQRVRDVLAATGLPPAILELEITEGVLADDVREATQVLEELNVLGVRLSIDDFGTGYSSMNYLRRLPFNMLKIDKSFIDGLPRNKDACAIVTAIITLAHSLELEVVAEGVETAEQFEYLRSLGCHLIQGFYFSPPVASGVLRQLVHAQQSGGEDGDDA